jgi:hypothetical protein
MTRFYWEQTRKTSNQRKKDDFLEEKCITTAKKGKKLCFFRGKIDQSSKKCQKLGVLA